jgi:hypothetical protein
MQWLVFSRLDPTAAKALSDILAQELEEFLAGSGSATEWSCTATKSGPKGTAKPEGTESVYKIDADPETDPIAASMLRALLERCDPIEVDWGTRQPAAEMLDMLRDFDAEPGLFPAESNEPAEDAEQLFERVLEAVHAASEDMERSAEMKEAIREASPQARAWMEHVVRHNVRSDNAVDTALDLGAKADAVHREIEAMLEELAD